MASKLAVQMYTIRDYTQTPEGLAESLEKIRAIGYEAVQFSSVTAVESANAPVSTAQLRRMLDDNGLKCIATHRDWDALSNRIEDEIAFHHALDCDYVAIGGLPGGYGERAAEGYRQFVQDAVPVIAKLKAAGIRFGYHNHDFEFRRSGEGTGTLYDILVTEGGANLMLEVDVYWVQHAGANPARLVRENAGRVPVIHLKDKEVVVKDGPVMAAIGEGNMDWDGILPACAAAGVAWYCVEQDVCRRDAFDCLRSSYEYLSGRGL
jgi:sugar phosphate isomerase/epimerase